MTTSVFGESVTTEIEQCKVGSYRFIVKKYVDGYQMTNVPAKSLGHARKIEQRILKSY